MVTGLAAAVVLVAASCSADSLPGGALEPSEPAALEAKPPQAASSSPAWLSVEAGQVTIHVDDRVRNRAGFSGWSVYSLRHYAITSWLRRGIPVHVVQKMAGHKHLSTTQRYVHHLKDDLEDVARRLGLGNMGTTAREGAAGKTSRAT
jgi:hypothetical protein